MKFSNHAIASIGLLLLSSSLNYNTSVEGRLGSPNIIINNNDDSRHLSSDATGDDYQTYLDQLSEAAGSTTAPIVNLQPMLYQTPSTVTAKFPPGVFDMDQAGDSTYMSTLNNRCYEALQNQTVASQPYYVLGCRIWFDVGSDAMPIALGTLVLEYNLMQYKDNGYTSDDVNNIFIPSAHAIMINEGCYELSIEDGEMGSQTSYASSSQYNSTINSSTDIDISASGSYGHVSVSAGYNKRVTKANSENKATKVAYGEQKYHAKVGVLTNRCLNDKNMFTDVIKKYNLIDQAVLEQWSTIMSATDATSLVKTSDFQNVAEGGLLFPTSYKYGAEVSYAMESTYTATSTATSDDMNESIKAGLSLTFEGTGASVSAQVNDSVSKKASSLNVEQQTTVTEKAFGYQLDYSCLQNNTCPTAVSDNAEEMKNDLNKLSPPYTHYAFGSLDDIVSWQTGATNGLGSVFYDALNTYYTTVQCSNPGGQGIYIKNPDMNLYWTDNGAGKLMTTTRPTEFKIVPSIANIAGEHSVMSLENPGLYASWVNSGDDEVGLAKFVSQGSANLQSYILRNHSYGTLFESSANSPSGRHGRWLTTISETDPMRLMKDPPTNEWAYEFEQLTGYQKFYANGAQVTGSGGSGNCQTTCTTSVAFPNQNGSFCG